MSFNTLDQLKKTLDQRRPLDSAIVANLREDLIVRWTYHSNAIENNSHTLAETLMVLQGIVVGGKRVRDLLWRPAIVRTGPAFKEMELGEALVPVNFVFSWKNADENVKLGRSTVWENDAQGTPMPYGMKWN